MDGIEAKTYTRVLNPDKKLYTVYEWQLPAPVSFRQLGLFALGVILWCPIAYIVGIPVSTSFGFILWFGPPVGLAIVGNKPMFEDKTLPQWIMGYCGFFTEPKRIMDGREVSRSEYMADDKNRDVEQHHFEISVWKRTKSEEDK